MNRRVMSRRVWWLAAGVFAPPLAGLVASGERALAVALLFALAEVPLAALAFWALGAWIPLDYWCASSASGPARRVGHVLPGPPLRASAPLAYGVAGGRRCALAPPAEAAYLESFTGTTMLLGFVVLGSMILAARPSLALGPVVVQAAAVAHGTWPADHASADCIAATARRGCLAPPPERRRDAAARRVNLKAHVASLH
jgi:hypothetical protein